MAGNGKCCAGCVRDRHLRREVFRHETDQIGICSYCGTSGEKVLDPVVLREIFGPVTESYEPDKSGEPLIKRLQMDWHMFREGDLDAAERLLGDILGDVEAPSRAVVPAVEGESDARDRWEAFRLELMHANRFFPDEGVDLDRLAELFPHLLLDSDEIPTVWYRARIHTESQPHTIDQMSAPPKEKARHGRANPAGIPYLYLASGDTTAISEIRPHTGERATVCSFQLRDDLQIIDLAQPRETVSPFVLADAEAVASLRVDVAFLEQLGGELARPVLPNAAAFDYTPSQYLCEYVKKCSYQGVRYLSAVGDDFNLALFDPAAASADAIFEHRITRVSVEHEEL